VACLRESENAEARSLDIQCLEPLYAARDQLDQAARRTQVREAAALLPSIKKAMAQALDEDHPYTQGDVAHG